jgi:hypothetical protein
VYLSESSSPVLAWRSSLCGWRLTLLLGGHGELQSDELESLLLEAADDLADEAAVHT